MKSKIVKAQVMHSRLTPVKHTFNYPVYAYIFDLDELSDVHKYVPLFGYNKARLISIHDSDYLGTGEGSIREKLLAYLAQAGCSDDIKRIELLTNCRYFNYVFNPVSFYYCYRSDGSVRVTVAEVNNTFHERHLYILDEAKKGRAGYLNRYTVKRAFHVSPFNEMQGDYDFHFAELNDRVDIRLNILREGREVFLSRLHGEAIPLTTNTLLRTIAAAPLRAALTIPRIYWEAAVLHYKKKMPIITKPNPSSRWTIRTAPALGWERVCIAVVRRSLKRLERGTLRVEFPDGSVEQFSGAASGETVSAKLNNYYIFPKLIRDGSIGLGDSYVAGDWTTENLSATLRFFLNNWKALGEDKLNKLKPYRWLNRLTHFLQRNSVKRSKDNISAHYDLSNDLFAKFLDPSMTYSSALYRTPNDTLEQAQLNKVDTILDYARIKAEDHVLEIGSGWGTLALRAAERFDCKVTSLSLSQEQLDIARTRLSERTRSAEGSFRGRVNFEYLDYRHVSGHFDKIVSVEMLEAVGHRYLAEFFATCERVLKPNGVVVLQVIAFPDYEYDLYLKRQDWIQKRIFPGSHLPSLTALMTAIRDNSTLIVDKIDNIGPHYARTLREWREQFEAQWDEISLLGFDETFRRTWRFYLASCEAEFATRWLAVYQIVLTRPNNSVLVEDDAGLSHSTSRLCLLQGNRKDRPSSDHDDKQRGDAVTGSV